MRNNDRLDNLEDVILVVTENQSTQIDLFRQITKNWTNSLKYQFIMIYFAPN